MNIKQKMIAAMAEVRQKAFGDVPLSDMLDAALAVLADQAVFFDGNANFQQEFSAVINHVKGLEA